jgi:hypothetical protein
MSTDTRYLDNRSGFEILAEQLKILTHELINVKKDFYQAERAKEKETTIKEVVEILEKNFDRKIEQLSQTYEKKINYLTNKLEAFTDHSIDDNSFRYIRFKIIKNRLEGGYTQIQKIRFRHKGKMLDMNGAMATTPDPIANGGSEGPENAINYNTSNKWCTPSSTPSIMIEFTRQVHIDEFSFVTANDCPERDPKQWILEGSNNKMEWTTLHYQKSDYFPTQMRNSALKDWFPLNTI